MGQTVSVPMIEYMGRYGLAEDFDIGVRTALASYGIDAKWMFFSGEKVTLAAGLAYQTMSLDVTSGSTESTISLTDITLPIYISYTFDPKMEAYLVPKYIRRSGVDTDSFTGVSIGMKYGKKKGFIGEYSMLTGDKGISQFNAGFFLNH